MCAHIDDHLVFDTRLGEYVPFANPSDAMIARLSLALDVPVHAVDLFLDILHNNSFKPGEVTIRRAGDIYQHVSEFRAERALVRARRPLLDPVRILGPSEHKDDGSLAPSYAFPLLILDLVLGELLQQYYAIPEPNRLIWKHQHIDLLSQMSLVHRSWTIPSQRALAHSVDIDVANDMRNIACSPIPGAWTRRLSVLFSCYDFKYDYFPVYESPKRLEGCRLSSLALRRFTNLRYLAIELTGLRDADLASGQIVLEVVSAMSSLEELRANVQSCALISTLCSVLPHLRFLRSLSLTCCVGRSGFGSNTILKSRPELFSDLCPGRNLQHVFLDVYDDYADPLLPIMEWLLRPREDWSIKSFRYDGEGGTFTRTKQIFDVIQPALPHLCSLELHYAFSPRTADRDQDKEFLRMILRSCTSLRQLAICGLADYVDYALTSAPPTLQRIQRKPIHSSPYCLFDMPVHDFVIV